MFRGMVPGIGALVGIVWIGITIYFLFLMSRIAGSLKAIADKKQE